LLQEYKSRLKSGVNPTARDQEPAPPELEKKPGEKGKPKPGLAVESVDIIKDDFWETRRWILADK